MDNVLKPIIDTAINVTPTLAVATEQLETHVMLATDQEIPAFEIFDPISAKTYLGEEYTYQDLVWDAASNDYQNHEYSTMLGLFEKEAEFAKDVTSANKSRRSSNMIAGLAMLGGAVVSTDSSMASLGQQQMQQAFMIADMSKTSSDLAILKAANEIKPEQTSALETKNRQVLMIDGAQKSFTSLEMIREDQWQRIETAEQQTVPVN